MDKDLIRIMIFTIGLLVIIVMVAWSYLQHEKTKQALSGYDDPMSTNDTLSTYDDEDDFDLSPIRTEDGYSEGKSQLASSPPKQTQSVGLKKNAIIQFSIIAPSLSGFNGVDLFRVLNDAGLEYGNLQIFERLDARRLVDFGVASMVKPGIFPSTNLAAFSCPGIVFFMQPSKVDNPLEVFEDFVEVFTFVAHQLGGQMRNQYRDPLTTETITQIRELLITT
jgi:cell division protein ZipA